MRSKLGHQTGNTIDVGAMTPHPCVMSVKLPLDNVVPLPQSGDQGLVIAGKEPNVLPLLAELLLQTITLERLLVSKSLIARATRKPTLSFSLANITQSLIDTADECLIASVEAIIGKLYPSLPSRIPIRISLMNSDSADDKFLLWNCSLIILSIAKD